MGDTLAKLDVSLVRLLQEESDYNIKPTAP